MTFRAMLKPAAYATACLIWLIAGLTLIGPQIGAMFDYTPDGPQQGLAALTCPSSLGQGERGAVTAQFANHSGKSLTYQTLFEVIVYGSEDRQRPIACEINTQVDAGQTATATCAITQVSEFDQTVRVTAWAEGENYHNSCDLSCPNSYRSACVIRANILTSLARPVNLAVNGIALMLGLGLAMLGAAWWLEAGRIGRGVIAAFFILSTEFLALIFGTAYAHWLPAAILNVALGLAVFVSARRRRNRVTDSR